MQQTKQPRQKKTHHVLTCKQKTQQQRRRAYQCTSICIFFKRPISVVAPGFHNYPTRLCCLVEPLQSQSSICSSEGEFHSPSPCHHCYFQRPPSLFEEGFIQLRIAAQAVTARMRPAARASLRCLSGAGCLAVFWSTRSTDQNHLQHKKDVALVVCFLRKTFVRCGTIKFPVKRL